MSSIAKELAAKDAVIDAAKAWQEAYYSLQPTPIKIKAFGEAERVLHNALTALDAARPSATPPSRPGARRARAGFGRTET